MPFDVTNQKSNIVCSSKFFGFGYVGRQILHNTSNFIRGEHRECKWFLVFAWLGMFQQLPDSDSKLVNFCIYLMSNQCTVWHLDPSVNIAA